MNIYAIYSVPFHDSVGQGSFHAQTILVISAQNQSYPRSGRTIRKIHDQCTITSPDLHKTTSGVTMSWQSERTGQSLTQVCYRCSLNPWLGVLRPY